MSQDLCFPGQIGQIHPPEESARLDARWQDRQIGSARFQVRWRGHVGFQLDDQRSRRIALNALYSDDKPWSLLVLAPRDDDAERCTRVVHLTGNGGDPEGHAAASREEPSK